MPSIEITTKKQSAPIAEQFFIAPILPTMEAPREWYYTQEAALDRAMKLSLEHGFSYEVYQRTHYILYRD